MQASHTEFARAVRAAAPTMQFVPARLAGRNVRQVAIQPFTFRIETRVTMVEIGHSVVPAAAGGSGRPRQVAEGIVSSMASTFAERPSPMPEMCTSSVR